MKADATLILELLGELGERDSICHALASEAKFNDPAILDLCHKAIKMLGESRIALNEDLARVLIKSPLLVTHPHPIKIEIG